jgi:tRNA1Val (adenine37-N6)-methyltransferase
VTTDACLFGSRIAEQVKSEKIKVKKALDIGAGSGLLSLMLAQKTFSLIDAIEIDKDAFEQAKENIAASPWKDRIKVFHDDVRSFEFPHPYDLIISNPPFYENELQSDDAKRNLALHSNELSLDELFQVIKLNLSPSGVFFLLQPYKRQEEIRKIFQKHKLSMLQLTFVRQSKKHDYFRVMLMGKSEIKEPMETSFDEISIWDEKKKYTKEFTSLLKDYYLNL